MQYLKMVSEEQIGKAVYLLKKAASPIQILLFGSYANGSPGKESDVDFLVVEKTIKDRRKEMIRLRRILRPSRIPVDLIVVSKDEITEWGHLPGTALHSALVEGKVLYESP